MTVNTDQAIFDAISAAVRDQTQRTTGIMINTKAFIDTFNSHRDRKLCTSLDVEVPPVTTEEKQLLIVVAQAVLQCARWGQNTGIDQEVRSALSAALDTVRGAAQARPDYATTPDEALEAMRTCPYWNGEKALGTPED